MTRWNPRERRTSRRRRNQAKWHETRKGQWYLFFEGRWRPGVMENGKPLTTKGWNELVNE